MQEWLDAYWARDVQELFRLEQTSFVRFVELVLARSGGIFEATAFAAPVEVSRPTISNLGALEITKVAHVIRPFSSRRGGELVRAPKVNGFDTGFVKTFRGWGELRPDNPGHLWATSPTRMDGNAEVEAASCGAGATFYMPSALFRGRRRFVERTCDRWFVLSAKYGVVDEEAVIEPYNQTLTNASQSERRAWSERALADLEERLGDLSGMTFECHAGAAYLDHGLLAGLRSRGALVERPVDGLTLGQQLAFYARSGREETAAEGVSPTQAGPRRLRRANPRIDRPTVNSPAIAAALLSFGETLPADGLIAIGPDPESDELLRSNGFAFLPGVIFDQGIRFERAWRAPLDLKERLGYLDPQSHRR